MSGRGLSADEARALLDDREAKGAWRSGITAGEGKVWAHDPTALGGPVVGEVCIFNANLHRPHNGNRALAAAAPDLAATVIAQAAEIDRLRAAIDDAATSLDGEHLATCARSESRYAHCDCVIGRVRYALTKAVSQ